MTRSLATTSVTRLALAASAAALLALVTAGSAQAAKTNSISIGIGGGGIVIGVDPDCRPRPWPRPRPVPQPQVEYVVQEYNPITGGLYQTYRFRNRSQAYAMRDNLARAHWVKWRFVGINEPIRYRRFSSSTMAQNFINNDGPSKSGKLGFAILTNETRAVPTRVRMTTRRI